MTLMKKINNDFTIKGIINTSLLLFILISVTLIIDKFNLDIKTAQIFYLQKTGDWILKNISPCVFMYKYGTIPGLIIALGSLILWIFSFGNKKLSKFKRDFLLIFLVIALGGGIIVNAVLKDNFGRPRPRQTDIFDGRWKYQPPLTPGIPGKGKSFPCGHCAMGFAPVAGIYLYYRSRKIACASGLTGILYGSFMSLTRIGQGAHFLSDTIWSLGILLLTGNILYYFLIKPKLFQDNNIKREVNQKKLGLIAGAAIIIITSLFLTRRPYYYDRIYSLEELKSVSKIEILTNIEKENFSFPKNTGRNRPHVKADVKGFGFPNAEVELNFEKNIIDDVLYLNIFSETTGYFSEKNILLKIFINVPDKNININTIGNQRKS